jgi:single-strand DNA-binding protein
MVKADVIGNIGMDAMVNNVNGKNVINFSLAHTEKYKDAQGVQRDKTLWVRCSYWVERTSIAPYLKKGTMVYVCGQPEVGVYQDKNGKWQAEFKLRVSQIQLLGGNKDNNNQQGHFQQTGNPQGSYQNSPSSSSPNVNDITEPLDDLPFG